MASDQFPLSSTVKNISRIDAVDGSKCLEEEVNFFCYDPVFIEDLSGRAHPPSHTWNNVRQQHSTYIRTVRNARVFGANYVVDTSGRCFGESLLFRKGGFEFYENVLKRFYPGNHPRLEFQNDLVEIRFANIDPNAIQKITEPAYLLTPFEPDNWARWLCHVLPSVERYKENGGNGQLLVRASTGWQLRFLELLGIPKSRIINHDPGQIYQCTDLTFFQRSASDFTISRAERNIFRDISSRFEVEKTQRPSRRIFVSRLSGSKKALNYRRLINEPELVSALQSIGFEIIEPEKLSFEEQVAIFSKADFVLGLGGSGMFNVVFCHPRARVVTIESSTTFITSHTGVFASLGLWYGVIYGSQLESSPSNPHTNWSIDVDAVLRTIKKVI